MMLRAMIQKRIVGRMPLFGARHFSSHEAHYPSNFFDELGAHEGVEKLVQYHENRESGVKAFVLKVPEERDAENLSKIYGHIHDRLGSFFGLSRETVSFRDSDPFLLPVTKRLEDIEFHDHTQYIHEIYRDIVIQKDGQETILRFNRTNLHLCHYWSPSHRCWFSANDVKRLLFTNERVLGFSTTYTSLFGVKSFVRDSDIAPFLNIQFSYTAFNCALENLWSDCDNKRRKGLCFFFVAFCEGFRYRTIGDIVQPCIGKIPSKLPLGQRGELHLESWECVILNYWGEISSVAGQGHVRDLKDKPCDSDDKPCFENVELFGYNSIVVVDLDFIKRDMIALGSQFYRKPSEEKFHQGS